MMITKTMPAAEDNDAWLVTESLKGNREAFRQIVERYQTLISSLAYCATGNLSRSEDLAQETFVSAWKQLADLREPAKLRSWLCSITRFLICKEFRRLGREPVHAAETLETVSDWTSPEPMPPDRVISDEERAILWRSLEHIPEIYREPLVLFYREHESIEAVARDLELSEDAVRQRLSRGRKLLQEQFLAFVGGALRQTSPGKAFTLGVMAAAPLLATTAKAATAGATAAKGSAMAKATGLGMFCSAILKPVSAFLGLLSPILLLGGIFGFKMGGDALKSSQQRESVATFWRILAGCLAVFGVLPNLVLLFLGAFRLRLSGDFGNQLLHGVMYSPGFLLVAVAAALIVYALQRRRTFRSQAAGEPEAVASTKRRARPGLWMLIATMGAASLLVFRYMLSETVHPLSPQEVRKIIADNKGEEVRFLIFQNRNGNRNFYIVLRENGRLMKFSAPADASNLALIKEQGINCPTLVEGRDFQNYRWPGRLSEAALFFILAIGGGLLLRRHRFLMRTPKAFAAGERE